MTLFINSNEHPTVFKNQRQIEAPNQNYFQVNYFSEMIKEQKKVNDALFQSFQTLKTLYQNQEMSRATQWDNLNEQLKELKNDNVLREQFEKEIIRHLNNFNEKNEQLEEMITTDRSKREEIMVIISQMNKVNQDILSYVEQYETSNNALATQMKEIVDVQQQLADNVNKQEILQTDLDNRLDNQEALMEKTIRQIHNIRSVLYERTNYLAEKIEESYHLVSSYVYKLVTGSEQPLTLLKGQQKKDEKLKVNDN